MKNINYYCLLLILLLSSNLLLSSSLQAQTNCAQPDYEALAAIYIANPDNTLNWDLSDCDVCNWTGIICVGGRVGRLSIPNKNISVLPPEISGLNEMTILNLANNQLSGLPAEFGSLTALNDLSLFGNQFSSLPPVIGSLSGLTSLGLGSNQLSDLPAEFGNLSGLTFLDLSGNQFATPPAAIWNLIGLTNLYLRENQLTSLPPEIGNLLNLRSLLLNDNQLSAIPPEIGNLSDVGSLYLHNNQLECLPGELSNLCSNGNITVRLDGNPIPYTWDQFCTEGLGVCCDNPDYEALAAIYNANPDNTLGWDLSDCDVCSWTGVLCPDQLRVSRIVLTGKNISVLPPEISGLTELGVLTVDNNQLSEIPPEIGSLQKVYDISLSGNQLSSLPPEIGSLPNLGSLALGSNQFSDLPPEIGNLTGLGFLGLNSNQFSTVPPVIWNLTNLTNLYLYDNQLASLPAEIGNLSALRSLLLYDNQLSVIPAEIGTLSDLVSLYMSNNQLECLPGELSNLCSNANITVRLDGNPIPYTWDQFCTEGLGVCCDNPDYEALAAIFRDNPGNTLGWNLFDCDLCSWNDVECDQNGRVTGLILLSDDLSTLPPEIGNLNSLARLVLGNNQLSSLPVEIGNLSNLTTLNLNDNQLSSLPSEIGNLNSLTALGLSNNQLSSLPVEFGNLSNLTTLNLNDNQLSSLPPEIGNLNSLTALGLNNNELTSLPTEIGNLTSLDWLDAGNNLLTSLPAEIGNLINLTYLVLPQNRLSFLPGAIGNLTNLTFLNVANNQLLILPSQIGNLTKLERLYLQINRLSSLPAEIGNFTSLRECRLSDNQLSRLPPEIAGLTNVVTLDLSNNLLDCLPPEMTDFCNLVTPNLNGNPFPYTWDQFCTEGLGACCELPEQVFCNDFTVNVDPIDGTYQLTPQLVAEFNTTVDPCIYDFLRVTPELLDCSATSTGDVSYQLIYTPEDGTETPLCFGYVTLQDRAAPTFTSCPTTTQYVSVDPNSEVTLTPADLGVSAVDNCTASPTLVTNPDPFIVSFLDKDETLFVDVIATDESNNSAACTVSVFVTVDNCTTGEEAPENLSVAVVGTDVVFTWDEVTGFTDYLILLEQYVERKDKNKWKAVKDIPSQVTGNSFAVPLAGLRGNRLHRFTVEVSGGGNNCQAIIEFIPNGLTGAGYRVRPPYLTQQAAVQSMRVFPNPVRDRLQVVFGSVFEQPQRLRLTDLHGRSLHEQVVAPGTSTAGIDVSGFPAGLYLLELRFGKERVQRRFVVQK